MTQAQDQRLVHQAMFLRYTEENDRRIAHLERRIMELEQRKQEPWPTRSFSSSGPRRPWKNSRKKIANAISRNKTRSYKRKMTTVPERPLYESVRLVACRRIVTGIGRAMSKKLLMIIIPSAALLSFGLMFGVAWLTRPTVDTGRADR